ncbi:hypothetical protein [Enterococcus sp. LJL90]
MTILEWVIMIGIAATIILIIFMFYFILQFLLKKSKLKKLPQRLPKNKKKRMRFLRAQKKIQQQKKASLRKVVILFFAALIFGSGTAYGMFYQSTNLSSDDADLVARSYSLVREVQEQLLSAENQEEEEDAINRNIRYLSTSLASYGSKVANSLNTVDGQTVLNRYYASLGELGLNLTRQAADFYGNPELVAQYSSDIERVITLEDAAFDYFQVNKDALETEMSGGNE